jgi:ABC-type transport system involved in multi-copper enzyme maturation permease subunit
MPPSVAAALDWLTRTVPWSNTRQAWQARLGLLLTLSAAVALVLSGKALPGWGQVASWAGLALTVAYLLRRGWVRVFGPVLFYDLVRSARRGRTYLVRCAYLVCLLIGLSLLYLNWDRHPYNRGPLRSREAAEFAEAFFGTFMLVQFGLVVLLTPGYTAGAIADEKERKTLEFLLATDLRNREIVLGKLASRLAHLTLLILGGLPVLSALQFMGGVDPNLLLAGFAGTGVTMVSLSAVGILCSVQARRGREAIVMTYLVLFGYVALCGAGSLLLLVPGWSAFPSTSTWRSPVTLDDLVFGLQSGHPVHALLRVFNPRAGLVAAAIPDTLRDYAIFHGLVASACLVWALTRLRAAALREPTSRAAKVPRVQVGGTGGVGRAIGNAPMIWKEVFAERGFRLHWTAYVLLCLLFVGSFIPTVFLLAEFLHQINHPYGYYTWETFSRGMNVWVRVVGTSVACLALVAVAVRAAGSIRGERDRETFDSLLTSPLRSQEILFGKWLGSVLSVRRWLLWLGLIWTAGVLSGGLSPLAVPMLLGTWLVGAGVLAGLGLWWSMVGRSVMRATMGTLSCAVGMSCGHWLIWLCCIPLMRGPGRFDFLEMVAKFQAGLTPPIAMGLLSFQNGDLVGESYRRTQEAREMVGYALGGTLVWLGVAVVLWQAAHERFRRMFLRDDVIRPDMLTHPRLRSRVRPLDVGETTTRQRQSAADSEAIEVVSPVESEDTLPPTFG